MWLGAERHRPQGAGISKPHLKSGFAGCGRVGRGRRALWREISRDRERKGKRDWGMGGRGYLSHEHGGSRHFSGHHNWSGER